MASKAYERIKAGLDDAIAYSKGDASRGVKRDVEVPAVDVRAARDKLGLSQDKFAEAFKISPSTLRKWEQGSRQPHGPAKVLLMVIEREPEAVLRALRDEERRACS
jgi:putative transcriptional regulator